MQILQKHSYCVRALAGQLEISESSVSQHLKKLREAGLVVGEKKGYFVHYKIKKERILEIGNYITQLAQEKKSAEHSCQKQVKDRK